MRRLADRLNGSLNDVTRAAIALLVVASTIGMIFLETMIPEAWWPVAVAVISYLYRTNGAAAGPPPE